MRLFLQWVLHALEQALPDIQTGIAIRMVAHLALWAQAQGRPGCVSLNWFALLVTNDEPMAAMALPTRIARINAAGDDPACVPRLILRVSEDAPFHPVGALEVAAARIPPFGRA